MWVEHQNPRRLKHVVNFEIEKKKGEKRRNGKKKVLKFIETILRQNFFSFFHACPVKKKMDKRAQLKIKF